jgi:hypothetical protein
MTEDRQWFADYIRARRLFVLGAGFSAAAGIPMTGTLLRGAMDRFQVESPGSFPRMNGYIRTCFRLGDDAEPDYRTLSLSEICTFLHYQELREYGGGERWSDAGSGENLALQYFIAKEVALRTPALSDVPELYRRFAEQLHPGDIVISFNWGTLLEIAVEAVGKQYAYEVSDGRIAIFKLHGSINWRLGVPENPVMAWHPFDFTKGMMREEIFCTEQLAHPGAWQTGPPRPEVQPFIVLPGFGKAFDVRRLAPLWYKPEFAFGFTHDIFIIGLSLARDDFIIRSLFLDNLPYAESYSGVPGRKIVIINPDPLVRDNFGFLVGERNVDFRCEPFSIEHLGLMLSSESGPNHEAG